MNQDPKSLPFEFTIQPNMARQSIQSNKTPPQAETQTESPSNTLLHKSPIKKKYKNCVKNFT
uniref:Uncharacterized protein n=1 Tax=Rhizophora mucronata TaxID=61149 RepID=A0A2P2JJR6_RHIMU